MVPAECLEARRGACFETKIEPHFFQMSQNFKRSKRQVEEAKRKKRQEKADKRLQRKVGEALLEAPPVNHQPPLSNPL